MTAGFVDRWSFKERRFVSFFLIYASTFIQGTEIAVILPTAWAYLRRLGINDETFLGFLISTYSVSAVIASLLVGHWVDRSENTRKVLLNVNLCQIVGSFLYFVGIHPACLVVGRFLCGLGSGIGSACFSDLSRATKVSERTRILTAAFAMRQVGILVGPMYTLALHDVDYQLGPFTVNEESAPGLVMAVYWTIFQILIFFLYSNVGREYHRQTVRVKKRWDYGSCDMSTSGEDHQHYLSTSFSGKNCDNNNDARWEETKGKLGLNANVKPKPGAPPGGGFRKPCGSGPEVTSNVDEPGPSGSVAVPAPTGDTRDTRELSDSLSANRRTYLSVFLDDRLIPLLFMQTSAYFCLTLVQTIIPPAVEHYFGYGTQTTSLIFMVAGFEGLLVYILMLFLAQRTQDRVIVLVGYLALVVSVCLTGWVSGCLSESMAHGLGVGRGKASAELFWPFVAGCGIIFMSVPLLCAAAVALTSKVVHRTAQGMAQGLRRTSTFMGVVFGPLWGGAMIYKPVYLYGMCGLLLAVGGLLFLLSFNKLYVCPETSDRRDYSARASSTGTTVDSAEHQAPSEKTPLTRV